MCYAIYSALILLFALFTDSVLEEFGLYAKLADQQTVLAAEGWEIVAELWPLLALAATMASAITYLATRRILAGNRQNAAEPSSDTSR